MNEKQDVKYDLWRDRITILSSRWNYAVIKRKRTDISKYYKLLIKYLFSYMYVIWSDYRNIFLKGFVLLLTSIAFIDIATTTIITLSCHIYVYIHTKIKLNELGFQALEENTKMGNGFYVKHNNCQPMRGNVFYK